MLLNGTAEDVAALDHRIALTKIRLDQLEVQHAAAVLAEAEAQAAHEAEQKRRKELHRKAMKASAEVASLGRPSMSSRRSAWCRCWRKSASAPR